MSIMLHTIQHITGIVLYIDGIGLAKARAYFTTVPDFTTVSSSVSNLLFYHALLEDVGGKR